SVVVNVFGNQRIARGQRKGARDAAARANIVVTCIGSVVGDGDVTQRKCPALGVDAAAAFDGTVAGNGGVDEIIHDSGFARHSSIDAAAVLCGVAVNRALIDGKGAAVVFAVIDAAAVAVHRV